MIFETDGYELKRRVKGGILRAELTSGRQPMSTDVNDRRDEPWRKSGGRPDPGSASESNRGSCGLEPRDLPRDAHRNAPRLQRGHRGDVRRLGLRHVVGLQRGLQRLGVLYGPPTQRLGRCQARMQGRPRGGTSSGPGASEVGRWEHSTGRLGSAWGSREQLGGMIEIQKRCGCRKVSDQGRRLMQSAERTNVDDAALDSGIQASEVRQWYRHPHRPAPYRGLVEASPLSRAIESSNCATWMSAEASMAPSARRRPTAARLSTTACRAANFGSAPERGGGDGRRSGRRGGHPRTCFRPKISDVISRDFILGRTPVGFHGERSIDLVSRLLARTNINAYRLATVIRDGLWNRGRVGHNGMKFSGLLPLYGRFPHIASTVRISHDVVE